MCKGDLDGQERHFLELKVPHWHGRGGCEILILHT